jgi:hypothetical protein
MVTFFYDFEDDLNPQGGESLRGINLLSSFIRCLVSSSTTTLSSTAVLILYRWSKATFLVSDDFGFVSNKMVDN